MLLVLFFILSYDLYELAHNDGVLPKPALNELDMPLILFIKLTVITRGI